MDNKESSGWGTLLHVMKWDSNAYVSSLKEPIEPAFRPSNHPIVTGSKLDGNTLHIKVSFSKWTAILWLKWLMYSKGSVRSLCMVNVGLVNLWGSLPFLNSACERWSGNLFKRFTHRIIPQAFGRWAFVSVLMVVVLIIRERLTGRSPWSLPITTILFIVRREIENGGSLPSPFAA